SHSVNLLQESWDAYRKRFIQGDGRVIDWEDRDKSTSEGQAYAMLRAVFANDRDSFDRTLNWAESNLLRKDASGQVRDSLWAWKWGKDPKGQWIQLDPNFASDADIDACYALILAAQRWNHSAYLDLAKTKLKDLWQGSTIAVRGQRLLLPGPEVAFRKGNLIKLNPSYFAPYAFRLFAQVDSERDWLALVDSSYNVLQQSAALSKVGLPSDWIGFDRQTGTYQPLTEPVVSLYSFDATRVWWRVALDAELYQEPRAEQYLRQSLRHLQALWRSQRQIPARIDLQGQATVNYDATSQYAMLYPALKLIDPELGREIYQQKLLSRYRGGFWDNENAYYTQNLAWFGLLPTQVVAQALQGQFPDLSSLPNDPVN
ncbi:MAG: glycosyl hydrolase family 8, partial [Synechococcales bacterium]|nr:glycosyl hydrolase family 8 [Synechococcales bacterium]